MDYAYLNASKMNTMNLVIVCVMMTTTRLRGSARSVLSTPSTTTTKTNASRFVGTMLSTTLQMRDAIVMKASMF